MRDIFDVLIKKISPCPPHIDMVKVTDGLTAANIQILKLPSKAGVDRFSVNAAPGNLGQNTRSGCLFWRHEQ